MHPQVSIGYECSAGDELPVVTANGIIFQISLFDGTVNRGLVPAKPPDNLIRYVREIVKTPLAECQDDLASMVDLVVCEVVHAVTPGPFRFLPIFIGPREDMTHPLAVIGLEERYDSLSRCLHAVEYGPLIAWVLVVPRTTVLHDSMHPPCLAAAGMQKQVTQNVTIAIRGPRQPFLRHSSEKFLCLLTGPREVLDYLFVSVIHLSNPPWLPSHV
jgi:hypothetical protein